ncbi:hypothetical protein AAO52_10570 [Salmonella enterica subsp. enterica serovar Typhimurium]|nr:hypothetical protein [Salmonella enterica subsp. enterica serovar Typhimurium]
MLRISVRASRTTSRRTPRSNQRRGGSSGIRSTSQASPQDRICSIQSLTRYISTDEKRAPRFTIAYFHERRSLNNFHRDRVITFEQIAE